MLALRLEHDPFVPGRRPAIKSQRVGVLLTAGGFLILTGTLVLSGSSAHQAEANRSAFVAATPTSASTDAPAKTSSSAVPTPVAIAPAELDARVTAGLLPDTLPPAAELDALPTAIVPQAASPLTPSPTAVASTGAPLQAPLSTSTLVVPPTATRIASLPTIPNTPPSPPAAATATRVPATSTSAPAAAPSLTTLEQQLYNGHNVERNKQGLTSLKLDASLVDVARQRAQDMATKGYFAHTSPSGDTAFLILNRIGYKYVMAGENIARNNYPQDQASTVAMTGFMNSPSHKENIMDPKFTLVGVGVATGSDGMKYFAVVFVGE